MLPGSIGKRAAAFEILGNAPVGFDLGGDQLESAVGKAFGQTDDAVQVADQVVAGVDGTLMVFIVDFDGSVDGGWGRDWLGTGT